MATLIDIVGFLDRELKVTEFEDDSNNGLQVENSGTIRKVCCGVDASLEFFQAAQQRGADLVVCHHGLSWRDSLKRITDLNYQRVGFLIRHDMALYACHLPLDAHPKWGNNMGMARALGLQQLKPFGVYHGKAIGLQGRLARPQPLARFAERVKEAVGNETQVMPFGKPMVRSVAMVVGGGAVGLEEAARAGVDVFLSGEPNLNARNQARDWGINAVFGGHYATESFGVQSLAALLAREFLVEGEFVPLGITY
jgi:dinuclear metal center YbgI/SA1388 family protein